MPVERQMRWHYSGYIPIPRFTPAGEVETRIPFQFYTNRPDRLSADEARERANQVALAFLQLIQDTAPGRRDDYGAPQPAMFSFVGMLPGYTGPDVGQTSRIPASYRPPISED